MTKLDEQGLPILGEPEHKSIPIDPKLMKELRELEDARTKSEKAAREVGFQLVVLTATAAAVGTHAIADDSKWRAFVYKIAETSGVPQDKVLGTDLEKGLVLFKP
jgi:hypothetical protein